MNGQPVTKNVVPDADLDKWRAAGWIVLSPAFTKGHSVVAWIKDSEPKEPA